MKSIIPFVCLLCVFNAVSLLSDDQIKGQSQAEQEPIFYISLREEKYVLADKWTARLLAKNNHSSKVIRATVEVSWNSGAKQGKEQFIITLEPGQEKQVGHFFGVVHSMSGMVVGARFY